jgi:copper oxidase (laccase) domain-containing protein
VIHIGWKGLLQGIEQKMLKLLEESPVKVEPGQLNFYLGPAIERKCYEVGHDLYEAFSIKGFRDDIFFPVRGCDRKYLLDVRKGIEFSLKEAGIEERRIAVSDLCTFCEAGRFPSYRRCPGSGERIYNFLLLKP